MPTTPTLTLCDDLVSALNTAWAPAGNDGVERHYFKRFSDGEDTALKLLGRRVVIFPTGYDNAPAHRGEDDYEHRVSVLTVERYTDAAGDPPKAWIDERVDFVFTHVVQGFDFGREPPTWNKKLLTVSADVQVCDVEKLVGGGKLFYSLVDLVFSELRDA